MKVVQEENIQQTDSLIQRRYQIDAMSCVFFILGMFISAYVLHHFIL
jgi:hypothetical protein